MEDDDAGEAADLSGGWMFRLVTCLLTAAAFVCTILAAGVFASVNAESSTAPIESVGQGTATLGSLAATAAGLFVALLAWRLDSLADVDPYDQPEQVSDTDLGLVFLALVASGGAGGMIGWRWEAGVAAGAAGAAVLGLYGLVVLRRGLWATAPLLVLAVAGIAGSMLDPRPAFALVGLALVWLLRVAVVAREAGGPKRWHWADVAGTRAEVVQSRGPRFAPLVLAVVVLGVALVSARELGANLSSLARPGDAASGPGSLFAADPRDVDDAVRDAADVWQRYACTEAQSAGARLTASTAEEPTASEPAEEASATPTTPPTGTPTVASTPTAPTTTPSGEAASGTPTAGTPTAGTPTAGSTPTTQPGLVIPPSEETEVSVPPEVMEDPDACDERETRQLLAGGGVYDDLDELDDDGAGDPASTDGVGATEDETTAPSAEAETPDTIRAPTGLGVLATLSGLQVLLVTPLLAIVLGGLLFRLRLRGEPEIARGPISLAWRAVPLFLVVSLAQTAALVALVEADWHRTTDLSSGVDWLGVVLWSATLLRWILLGVIALPLLVGLIALTLADPDLRQLMILLRAQLAMVGLLAVILRHEQVPDVIRRWAAADAWETGLTGVALVIVVAIVLRLSGELLVKVNGRSSRLVLTDNWRWWGVLSAALAALAAILWAWPPGGWRGLAIPVGFAAAAAALSAPLAADAKREAALPRLVNGERTGPRLLGAAVPALFAVAVFAASAGYLLYDVAAYRLLAFGAGLLLAALLVYVLPTPALGALAVFAVAAVIGAGRIDDLAGLLNPFSDDRGEAASELGALGVLAVFGLLATVALTLLVTLAEYLPAPPALELVWLRRVPMISLLLVWSVVAASSDSGGYHDVAIVPSGDLVPAAWEARPILDATDGLLDQWEQACLADAGPVVEGSVGGRRAVPLVFVSAAGGGIRAAYWTALVLDELARRLPDESCARPIFVASGVSGGSVGLVTHMGRQLAGVAGEASSMGDDATSDPTSVPFVLGADYLAPDVAQMLWGDLPRGLFTQADQDGTATADRAEALERAWERSWGALTVAAGTCSSGSPAAGDSAIPVGTAIADLGFLGVQSACDLLPTVVLNGTEVNTGCRFATSVLDNDIDPAGADTAAGTDPAAGELDLLDCRRSNVLLGGDDTGPLAGTIDLVDVLCEDTDLRFSTAALLSARFPFVSPTGRVPGCGDGGATTTSFVVDGGYLENSGAATITELYDALTPAIAALNQQRDDLCVVPTYMQIDNGYASQALPEPDSRPWELFAPLRAVAEVRSAAEAQAEQRALLGFGTAQIPGGLVVGSSSGVAIPRLVRIEPRAHPGVQAPLGWALSETSRRDLEDQLERQVAELDTAAAWFSDLTCDGEITAPVVSDALWTAPVDGADAAVVDGTMVYVASSSGVRALDIATGAVVWSAAELDDLRANLVVRDDVLAYTSQETTAEIDLTSGEILAQEDTRFALAPNEDPASATRNGVTVRLAAGRVQVTAGEDVLTLEVQAAPGAAGRRRVLVASGPWILAGLRDGQLLAVDTSAEDLVAALEAAGFEPPA